MLIRTLIKAVEPAFIARLSPLSASFSTATVLSKKKGSLTKDPIPTNIENLPLEETLPTDDGEPRPNSTADFTKQLTIVASNLDVASDGKLEMKWSKEIPHLETPRFPGEYVVGEWPPKGRVYWKLPFKVKLQKDRIYKWCSCGASKNQPFCDMSHHYVMHAPNYEFPRKPRYRPVKFRVPETGEYWLCQCKQTSNRPFCDGTHRLKEEITQLERPMPTDGKVIPVKIKS